MKFPLTRANLVDLLILVLDRVLHKDSSPQLEDLTLPAIRHPSPRASALAALVLTSCTGLSPSGATSANIFAAESAVALRTTPVASTSNTQPAGSLEVAAGAGRLYSGEYKSSGGFLGDLGDAAVSALRRPIDDVSAYIESPTRLREAVTTGTLKALHREALRSQRREDEFDPQRRDTSYEVMRIPSQPETLPLGEDGRYATFRWSNNSLGLTDVGVNYDLISSPLSRAQFAFDLPSGSRLLRAIRDEDLSSYFLRTQVGFDYHLSNYDTFMFRVEPQFTTPENSDREEATDLFFRFEIVSMVGGRSQ